MNKWTGFLNSIEKYIAKHESHFKKYPLVIGLVTTLFWYVGVVLRVTTSFPEIALVDLGLGAIAFSVVTLLVKVVKNKIPSYLLLALIVTQALIMGMSSSLIVIGVIWVCLAVALGVALFPHWVMDVISSLKSSDTESAVPISIPRRTATIISVLFVVAFLFFVRSYVQPEMGVNQQCYFATAHQSSYRESLYEKFASVWEIKPITHRAFIYGIYEIATNYFPFHDKAGFEKTANGVYFLWTVILITAGIFLGRREWRELSGVHWWYLLILAVSFQGVMVGRSFEVEEMVFSLSVLLLGMLFSRNRILLFIAPLLALYISSLKILTLFIPIALLLFTISVISYSRKEWFAVLLGTLFALVLTISFVVKYPLFLTEIAGARAMQQGTVFFFGGVRIGTFIGALAKAFYYNPFVMAGVVANTLLLFHYNREKQFKKSTVLMVIWFLLGIIPLVMGKAFSYYALTLTIGAFLSIVLCCRNAQEVCAKTTTREVLWAVVPPLLVLLYQGMIPVLIATVLISAITFVLKQRVSEKQWGHLFVSLYLFSFLFWLAVHMPWQTRPASSSRVGAEIVQELEKDPDLEHVQMLYLTFGTVPYSLGLENTNRYFYTLPMLRHAQMEKVANATKGELKYLKRFGRDMADNISESVSLQECLAGAVAFRGKYIIHDNRGWGNFELYPELDSLVQADYIKIVSSGRQTLYMKKSEAQ